MPKVGVFAAIINEYDEILLTKLNYGSRNWTLPGGHLEENESPITGVKREVLEETGYIIDVDDLICIYSAPLKDDLVLLFRASIKEKVSWEPNDEVEQVDFFKSDKLPSQIHGWNIKRIEDVFLNKKSNLHIF